MFLFLEKLPIIFWCLFNFLGADIGSLSSSAYGRALERKLNQLRQQAQNSFSKKADFTNYKGDVDDTDTLQNSKNIHENGGIKSFLYSENLSHYINNLPAGELTVTVSRNDFIEAVHNIKPSVTRSELDHYEALGKEFNDLNVWKHDCIVFTLSISNTTS